MNLGTFFEVLADVINVLKQMNLIDASGNFVTPTAAQDVQLAASVEQILRNHGVNIPEQIDVALQLLPLILRLIGVK